MFFALTNAELDAGIAAWDAKWTYDSVRPVTAVELLYKGKNIRAWGGPGKGTVEMDGSRWIPYQPATFPTPLSQTMSPATARTAQQRPGCLRSGREASDSSTA
jgi:hypothetical protein